MTPEERMAQHEAVMAQIDQRLDRVAARHAALAESVELMAHRQEEAFAKNQVLMAHILESIDSLANIAHAHERRISDLEEGRN